jgi:hypothetical protein
MSVEFTERRELYRVDAPAGVSATPIAVWLRNAVAINFVLVAALVTAGMIFAVNPATVVGAALGFSLLAWALAALVLIPAGLISLARRLRRDTPMDALHDSWLDE